MSRFTGRTLPCAGLLVPFPGELGTVIIAVLVVAPAFPKWFGWALRLQEPHGQPWRTA